MAGAGLNPSSDVSGSLPAGGAGRLGRCFREGLVAGVRTAGWLLSLMLPISFAVILLHATNALTYLTRFLGPAFTLIDLPAEAAVSFAAGALVNCYTGIAAMGSLPLTSRQVTILALMILVAHNLIVEVSVQRRAGVSGIRILALRLAASAASGVFLSWALPHGAGATATHSVPPPAERPLAAVLVAWARNSGVLTVKIVVLVTGLMILQRVIREFGVAEWLARVAAPLLGVLGLPRRAAFLWIVANTLGLAYGAGVLLDEIERGALLPEEADLLNRSIAVCHSLLEDTLLFVAVGASAVWITVPRLVLAGGAVWFRRGWRRFVAPRRSG